MGLSSEKRYSDDELPTASSFCFSEKGLKMVAGSFYIPKKNKLKPLGEDAHFICPHAQTIGVADGVGGWAKQGIDAGEYARKLMINCVSSVLDQPKGSFINPKQLLNEAFLNNKAEGSSTACILSLTGDYLHAANVGDSGFVIIRGGQIVYESPTQQHSFNCPYQLGNTSKDWPSCAMEITAGVEAGDVIVLGTDGLFDNVYLYEIEDLVEIGLEQGDPPRLLAWTIAQFALDKSLDDCACSPFECAARTAGFDQLIGGKYDDITVIVGYIRPTNQ